MSIVYYILLYFCVSTALKLPPNEKYRLEESSEESDVSDDSSSSGSYPIDDNDGSSDVFDPPTPKNGQSVVNPLQPGPSNSRRPRFRSTLPSFDEGEEMVDPNEPGPSHGRRRPHPLTDSSSTNTSYSTELLPLYEVLDAVMHPISNMSTSTSSGQMTNNNRRSQSTSSSDTNAQERRNRFRDSKNADRLRSDDSVEMEIELVKNPLYDPNLEQLLDDLMTSGSTRESFSEMSISTGSSDIQQPPIIQSNVDNLNMVENYFRDPNTIPIIIVTPPDNEEDPDESSDSRVDFNTTASSNNTSGYVSFDSLNVNNSAAHEDERKAFGGKTFTSMNVEYSPFETFKRIISDKRHDKNAYRSERSVAKSDLKEFLDVSKTKKDLVNNVLSTTHEENCLENTNTLEEKWAKYIIDIKEPIWHSFEDDDQDIQREGLKIQEITSENSIQLDRDIEEWLSLSNYAVGRGTHGLTLIMSHSQGFQVNHIEFNDPVSGFTLFQWWDQEIMRYNIGLILAQDTNVIWYHLHNNQLTQLWFWTLTEPMNGVKIYQINDQWKIVVSYDSYVSSCTSSVYGLNLWQNFWLEQRIDGCVSLSVANNGRYIIAIGSDMTNIILYKYNQDQRFYVNFQNISSPGVQHISTFTAGPYSFLAVGGANSAIYQFRGNQMLREVLKDYYLNHIEVWLPIKVEYYRNDVILLVQHRLHHDSHQSYAIEALHWDGSQFTFMEHAPCITHIHEMYGFHCMTDAENERGILGATVLTDVQGRLIILTATHEFTPDMFEIKIERTELPDPVMEKIESIEESFESLKRTFLDQLKVVEKAKMLVHETGQNNELGGLVNADNLIIKEMVAPTVSLEGNINDFFRSDSVIHIGGKTLSTKDLDLDITTLLEEVKSNNMRIRKLAEKIEKAADFKRSIPKSLQKIQTTGQILSKKRTKIKNANVNFINDMNINEIFKSAIRKPNNNVLRINGETVLNNLAVNNIETKNVNGMDLNEASIEVHEPLTVFGDLKMENPIHILNDIQLPNNGRINGINLKRDIFVMGGKSEMTGPLVFENVAVNHLLVQHTVNNFPFTKEDLTNLIENEEGNTDLHNFDKDMEVKLLRVGNNLHFDTINGVSWNDFMKQVVFKSEDSSVDFLRVDGKIFVENNFSMEFLNTLRYPQDYFTKNENEAVQVSGMKTFNNALFVGEVNCERSVNGIDPERIVTLSSKQMLDNFTFHNLTITERINVQGEIKGKELDAFLSNPSLTEVTNINSNVIFKNLNIQGTVLVQNTLNGTEPKTLFENVVEINDNPLYLESSKVFDGSIKVEKGLNVKSQKINNIKIRSIISLEGDQDTFTEYINGKVKFENIQVEGTFNGVDVNDLVENSVNIFHNHSIDADLVFEDGSILEVNKLEVLNTINDKNVNNLITNDNIMLDSPIFDTLTVDHIVVEGNIENSWSVSGVNLYDFENIRLSKTKKQIITAPYTIQNCKVENLYFKYLNDKTDYSIYQNLKRMADLKESVINGITPIRNLFVNEDLNVNFINGVDLKQLANDAISTEKENFITNLIAFVDPIKFHSLKLTGNAYGKNFDKFLHDVVQKSDSNVIFEGKKIVSENTNVEQNINMENFNGIKKSQILTANTDQNLKGTIVLFGNLSSKYGVFVDGILNKVDVDDFALNNVYYRKPTHVI